MNKDSSKASVRMNLNPVIEEDPSNSSNKAQKEE